MDLAKGARVSQRAVSRVERGLLEELSFGMLDRIAGAVDVTLRVEGRWHGGLGERLVDAEHSAIVQAIAAILRGAGWVIVAEYTFNHYGDRGSVDLVAWHEASRTLLLVEVKSRITNLQDLFARFATKLRIVPNLLAGERGWKPQAVGRLIALPGTTGNRSIVASHRDLFDASYPARAREINRWLQDPTSDLGGVWFIPPSRHAAGKRALRVRRTGGTPSRA